MLNDVVIINRLTRDPYQLDPSWMVWTTCVRQVAFGHRDLLKIEQEKQTILDTDQVYAGRDAYQFCLETITGLNSPMLGETEVGGQFRQWALGLNINETYDPMMFQRFFSSMLTDFKEIRQKYLVGIGSHSYGSVIRKYSPKSAHYHILGAGQLVEEVLPWLSKVEGELHVYARRIEQAVGMRKVVSRVEAHQYTLETQISGVVPKTNGVLVVAAPISAKDIETWLRQNELQMDLIIDLRAEASQDVIQNVIPQAVKRITLQELFVEVQKNQQVALEKVAAAKKEIHQKSVERMSAAIHRPYGWDDLCV